MLRQDALLLGVVSVFRETLHRLVVPAGLHSRDARFAVGDAPDPLPRKRVERVGEGVQVLQTSYFHGVSGDLPHHVRLTGRRAQRKLLPHGALAEGGSQVLAPDPPGPLAGKPVYPVGGSVADGGIGHLDPDLVEDAEKVRFVPGGSPGDEDPVPDVGDPRVPALLEELFLRPAEMHALPRAPPPRGEPRRGTRLPIFGEEAEAPFLGKPLDRSHELLRGRVLKTGAGVEVGVVHHHMGVHDPVLVVVVVDDGDLEAGEVLAHPGLRQFAQGFQRDLVGGIRAHNVVLVGAGGPALPRGVVSERDAREVHLVGPPPEPAGVLGGPIEVHQVNRERAAALGEVALDPCASRMPADRFDDGHR